MAVFPKPAFLVILTLQVIVFALYMWSRNFSVWWTQAEHRSTVPEAQLVSIRGVTTVGTSPGNSENYMATPDTGNETFRNEHRDRGGSRRNDSDNSNLNNQLYAKTPEDDEIYTMRHQADTRNLTFQPIDDKKAWLYSAHFDDVASNNKRGVVRVFGLVKREFLLRVYCHFSQGDNLQTTKAILTEMPDSHDKDYVPSYADCPVRNGMLPNYVSVTFRSRLKPTNQLQVVYPTVGKRHVTVCYSILFHEFKQESQLIFSIEFNRILGAEHFIVYIQNISSNVDYVLQQYQKNGLVTVLPWPIPTLKSWAFGQMTALNDCFYRTRSNSQFVIVLDTDELIVPRHHDNFVDLIENITKQMDNSPKHSLPTGSFLIQCSFFSTNSSPSWDQLPAQVSFTEEEKRSITTYKIQWFWEFWRSEFIFPARDRSKYLARPRLVDVAGIHYVHKFRGEATSINVSDSLALLHHYRTSKLLKDAKHLLTNNATFNLKLGIVQDASLFRFKSKWYPILLQRYKQFEQMFL